MKEKLTMEEKPIRIIVENYNGYRITFTMSNKATIEAMYNLEVDESKVTEIHIDAYDDNILIEKEDII